MDVLEREDLSFPTSLPDFQKKFPDEAACARWLTRSRWPMGFLCQHCGHHADPFLFANRPTVLRCRKCEKDTRLTVGTVMERSHTPLTIWFWGAYLVASHTPGMSAVQFQRQLGLTRYETAFQILHKLRASMIRPDIDRIGGVRGEYVEVDETYIGGKTRGEGRGVHHKSIVVAAVEVRHRQKIPGKKSKRDPRVAGRVRLQVVPDRSAKSLCGFVEAVIKPKTMIVTDDHRGYISLKSRGFKHYPVAENGDPEVAADVLPKVHIVFSNLKSWLRGIHHGVSEQHLQAYLNEFAFRFNRREYPFAAFRSLIGFAGVSASATYAELYSGEWKHPTPSID